MGQTYLSCVSLLQESELLQQALPQLDFLSSGRPRYKARHIERLRLRRLTPMQTGHRELRLSQLSLMDQAFLHKHQPWLLHTLVERKQLCVDGHELYYRCSEFENRIAFDLNCSL